MVAPRPEARATKAKARVDRANEVIQQSRQAASDIASKRSLDIALNQTGWAKDSRPGRHQQKL